MDDQVTVNLEPKDSSTSIASDINKLEIESQSSEVVEESSKNAEESSDDKVGSSDIAMESESIQTSSESSGSSESSSVKSSSAEEQQEVKKKRKRRRKRKRKIIVAAYVPDEPFPKRYKKVFMDISMKPKIHVKFDDSGNIVSYQNNYKPRIISALAKNLLLTDSINSQNTESTKELPKEDESIEVKPVISLKPRIIKAIGT